MLPGSKTLSTCFLKPSKGVGRLLLIAVGIAVSPKIDLWLSMIACTTGKRVERRIWVAIVQLLPFRSLINDVRYLAWGKLIQAIAVAKDNRSLSKDVIARLEHSLYIMGSLRKSLGKLQK